MAWLRAALVLAAAGAAAAILLSGGSAADPRTPTGLPGRPPPFLGTAVVGAGYLTAAIDSYGDVVDLRPTPTGPALIDNPVARQAAGTVAASTGIVPRVHFGDGRVLPFWRADSVAQRYRPGTNVLVTEARFKTGRAAVVYAAPGGRLACITHAPQGATIELEAAEPAAAAALRCDEGGARGTVARAAASDRAWLRQARRLGSAGVPGGRGRGAAPAWAQRLLDRSLLTLRALTDRHSGAIAAGARDGWAYVWPRDAGAAALALAASGYHAEARRVARFLLGLDLNAAARFDAEGAPVPGRAAQGDASGWTAVAARAAGLTVPAPPLPWRNRADYQEGDPGDYLANAIAAKRPAAAFAGRRGLLRLAADPGSGLDSAAAWAVRPFPQPDLFPAVRRTLLRLAGHGGRFGLIPGEAWSGGADPWSAPTAWSAWSLAALGERQQALGLLADLRRAATPTGSLPERVDARTGVARSTTPLTWAHAFTILALLELWPPAGRA